MEYTSSASSTIIFRVISTILVIAFGVVDAFLPISVHYTVPTHQQQQRTIIDNLNDNKQRQLSHIINYNKHSASLIQLRGGSIDRASTASTIGNSIRKFDISVRSSSSSSTDSISTISDSATAVKDNSNNMDTNNDDKYVSSLIPREVLFGNPKYTSPILSPDGKYLAYIAPSSVPPAVGTEADATAAGKSSNVLNVFVVQLQQRQHPANTTITSDFKCEIDHAKQVTNDTSRGIRTILWGEDSEHLFYLQDDKGNENFHCYAVFIPKMFPDDDDTAATISVQVRDLTPGENVKVSSIMTNRYFPNEILITTNERNASQFDVYRCSLSDNNPTTEMIAENPGNVIGWDNCNHDRTIFTVRSRTIRNPIDSSNTIQVRTFVNNSSDTLSDWKDLITYPFGEEGSFIDFIPSSNDENTNSNENNDGEEYGYITSTIDHETKALLKVNVNTGAIVQEIVYNPKCDVSGITLDRTTKAIKSISFNYARIERMYMNDTYKAQMRYLMDHPPPEYFTLDDDYEITVVSRTRDETIWIVLYGSSNAPGVYVLYNSITNHTQILFINRPELLPYTLQPMEDVRIKARDGLELVGYLTRAALPKSSQQQQPLVLLVHGGPWARDVWSYNPTAQWLSNRGYHVLQVNYRGSTGYGKTFLHLGDKQWGVGTMQHDLTDSVQWAIDQGFVDPTKVCIYGGSYGGYACLAGLTFTPTLYACGVDIVGPSNVKTLLDSIPPYWGPIRNGMLLKIGNVDDDEEFNRQISPLYHIDAIRAPLLIGQGANDPRVKQSEADQIAFALQDKDIAVEYILYPDEGHGFVRPENKIDFNGRAELFLSHHLGGRYEPFVPPVGNTATFPLTQRKKA